jgi:hypothetical protein
MNPVKSDSKAIAENIEALNRSPFQDELVKLLGCSPSKKQLAIFALKNPGAYYNAVKTLSALAGFHDRVASTETNIYMQINAMPDSKLNEELSKVMEQINKISADTENNEAIEGEYEEIETSLSQGD